MDKLTYLCQHNKKKTEVGQMKPYAGLCYCPLFCLVFIHTFYIYVRDHYLLPQKHWLYPWQRQDVLLWYVHLIVLANFPSFLSHTQESIQWPHWRNILCVTAQWSIIVTLKTCVAMPVLNEESKLFWKVRWFPHSHILHTKRPRTESQMSRLSFCIFSS